MDLIFLALAGIIHAWIFVMESLLWGRPKINKLFRVSAQTAKDNRLFAFNQGFYNLFLAFGAASVITLNFLGTLLAAFAIEIYVCAFMVGAALTLIASQPKLFRAALIQGLPPLLALVFLGLKFI